MNVVAIAMETLDAKAVLGRETTPERDGERLAKALAGLGVSLDRVVIDMTNVAPEELVSTFVNAFVFGLHSRGIDVNLATRITWKARYEREAEKLRMLVRLCVEEFARRPAR